MNETESLLESFIEKHNFVVRVYVPENSEHCVAVDFAGRKRVQYEIDIFDVDAVTLIEGISYTNILKVSEQDEAIEEYIPVTTSAARLYILLDIYRQCRELDLPLEIVRFFDASGEKTDYMKMFKFELDKTEAANEASLNEAIHYVVNKEVDPNKLNAKLEEVGLLHSFLLLRGLL